MLGYRPRGASIISTITHYQPMPGVITPYAAHPTCCQDSTSNTST